jgi:hypothetical protein
MRTRPKRGCADGIQVYYYLSTLILLATIFQAAIASVSFSVLAR